MFVVMITSECAPVAQAGGLGQVVFGLSRELELRGHAVEIIMPKYDCMDHDQIFGLTVAYQDLQVPWYSGFVHCTVWFGFVHGRRCFFIEPHSPDQFFNRGHLYGSPDDAGRFGFVHGRRCFFIEPHSPDQFFNRGHLYGSPDDAGRFAFLSKAALEFMWKAGKRPEVIHVHDWQTAAVPVLLYEIYQHLGMAGQRVCYTIHNFAHQGICGEYVLWATGLTRPEHFFGDERLRDNFNHSAINLMKGGIVYSNFITTVSPQHAWEVTYTDQGMGLGRTLHVHREKFGGVLNGIDYEVWNPEIDILIPSNYTADTVERKYADKDALRDRLLLRKEYKPVIAYLGRVDHQKGVHLIEHAIFYALAQGAQFVLLGACPDPAAPAGRPDPSCRRVLPPGHSGRRSAPGPVRTGT